MAIGTTNSMSLFSNDEQPKLFSPIWSEYKSGDTYYKYLANSQNGGFDISYEIYDSNDNLKGTVSSGIISNTLIDTLNLSTGTYYAKTIGENFKESDASTNQAINVYDITFNMTTCTKVSGPSKIASFPFIITFEANQNEELPDSISIEMGTNKYLVQQNNETSISSEDPVTNSTKVIYEIDNSIGVITFKASNGATIGISNITIKKPTMGVFEAGNIIYKLQEMGCASYGTDIYLFGGYRYFSSNEYYRYIFKYDTITNTCTILTPTFINNVARCVSIENNGVIYTLGGYNNNAGGLNNIYKYIISENKLEYIRTLPVDIYSAGACKLNDYIYIVGGTSNGTNNVKKIYKWNINHTSYSDTISSFDLPINMYDDPGVAIVNTNIFIFYSAHVYKFDTTNDQITTLDTVSPLYSNIRAVELNGRIYLFGASNKIYMFDPTNETITELSVTIPQNERLMGVAKVNNKIYLLGGNTNTGSTIIGSGSHQTDKVYVFYSD